MSHPINLEQLDVDGDVREAAEAAGFDRSTFLRNGAIAGAGLVAGASVFGLPSLAEAKISSRKSLTNDVRILNYALTLEYLEAAFYAAAVAADDFASPELKQFAQVVAVHEADHVKFLKKGLGKKAVKAPKLDSSAVAGAVSKANFGATAAALEDTGVAAYAGQGPNIKTRAYVQAALSIHSVEARHAAWIRYILGGGAVGASPKAYPAPATFDKARSERATLKIVVATGLLA
ncbi:ferritin-like domain-containing protein [Patulibacter defluvii]|uniref:ferritin-like domain-containing protein n=1 Tax=Patulibacter defluvii TaxID=3095358 RepID=UPI002A763AE2|nr:ferritin-like domain-containing protein [Patulibacter sp. DM4]